MNQKKLSIYHIYPENDPQEHNLEAASCSCIPKIMFEEGDMLIIHNSFDGREILEEIESELNSNNSC